MHKIVVQHHACNPRIFGSVRHGRDKEDRDPDLLIDPTSMTTHLLQAIKSGKPPATIE
ncbi:hypothetical protein ACXZ1M_00135 [Duganella sp. PWIR1]